MNRSESPVMKRPWVIGLLSIVPGLGLIVLGQAVAGFGVMAVTLLLIVLSLVSASADLSTWLFVCALLLWMFQLGYAWLAAVGAAAPRKSRREIVRQETRRVWHEGSGIRRGASELLTPLLLPGQHLRLALAGSQTGVGLRAIGELLLAVLHALGGGAYIGGPSESPTICIGITQDELVYTITRRIPKPANLKRIPLGEVSSVKHQAGRWGFDRLVLYTGNRKLLSLHTARSLRPTVQELTAILGKSPSRLQSSASSQGNRP